MRGGWQPELREVHRHQRRTRTGANVGSATVPVLGPLGGRVELNYTMFGKNTKLATGPTNTVGLMFGALVPLR